MLGSETVCVGYESVFRRVATEVKTDGPSQRPGTKMRVGFVVILIRMDNRRGEWMGMEIRLVWSMYMKVLSGDMILMSDRTNQ